MLAEKISTNMKIVKGVVINYKQLLEIIKRYLPKEYNKFEVALLNIDIENMNFMAQSGEGKEDSESKISRAFNSYWLTYSKRVNKLLNKYSDLYLYTWEKGSDFNNNVFVIGNEVTDYDITTDMYYNMMSRVIYFPDEWIPSYISIDDINVQKCLKILDIEEGVRNIGIPVTTKIMQFS